MAYNYPNPPSRYLPIWQALKRDKTVSLVIVPTLRKRIVKAVQKRRDLDILYKYELAEGKKVMKIFWEYKANTLTFHLKHILKPEDI